MVLFERSVLTPNPADVSFEKSSYGMIHMLMAGG